MKDLHVVHETATRDRLRAIGDPRPDRERLADVTAVAWCTELVHPQSWRFVGVDHVVLSLVAQNGIKPCPACLRAIREVINAEIGKK